MRLQGRRLLVAAGSSALVLAALAALAWILVHRSPVQIADASDPGIPPEFDVLLLSGRQDGGTYAIELVLAGAVQDSRYTVGLLVQELSRPGETSVHELDYMFGEETRYAIATIRSGNSLTFLFPLSLLRPGTYVVGLDAVSSGPGVSDLVEEGSAGTTRIHRLLPLPVEPGLLAVASAAFGVVAFAHRILASRRVRQGSTTQ